MMFIYRKLAIGILLLLSSVSFAQTVSTFAGTVQGKTDSPNAAFYGPNGMVADAAGNLYVADMNNSLIRKIAPDGTVSTFAGSGTPGYKDGTGIEAQFKNPCSLTIDASGNLYVADTHNHRIRKITPAGVVSHYSGSGLNGNADGSATAGELGSMQGITMHQSSGIIYVTEGNKLRKIATDGSITTFAGSGFADHTNGTGLEAEFRSPQGMVTDESGNIYVCDANNNAIRKITPAGIVTTFAGGTTSGYVNATGTAAKFNRPENLCIDAAGNLYVSDLLNYRIRKITPAGVVTTVAGVGTAGKLNGAASVASFDGSSGIAIVGDNLYVADFSNNLIRKIEMGITTDLKNQTSTSGVRLYPNPASSQLTIVSEALSPASTAKFITVAGDVVYSTSLNGMETQIAITPDMKAGVYLVHILDANGQLLESTKIIIQ